MTALESGVVSDVLRLHDVRYSSPPGELPGSFVLKVPSRSDERRGLAVANGLYLKELNFYRLLAPGAPIRSPHVYACVDDGATSPERFAILMEDLSRHARVFDQIDDPPSESDARAIARDAARLHAHYWESDATRLPWLAAPDGRYVFALDVLCRASGAAFPIFSAMWSEMYGEDLFAKDPSGEARQLCELLCGPSCDLVYDGIYDVLSSRPKTVLHGDLRADNVFRADASTPAGGSPLTFIDWQLVHVGPPGPDLAEAFMASLEPEVRRRDLTILAEYRDTLLELNPAAASYTYEMLVEDYALGCCLWLTTFVSGGAATLPSFHDPGSGRMKRLWEKMWTRAMIAVTDLSCLSRVESLVGRA